MLLWDLWLMFHGKAVTFFFVMLIFNRKDYVDMRNAIEVVKD